MRVEPFKQRIGSSVVPASDRDGPHQGIEGRWSARVMLEAESRWERCEMIAVCSCRSSRVSSDKLDHGMGGRSR